LFGLGQSILSTDRQECHSSEEGHGGIEIAFVPGRNKSIVPDVSGPAVPGSGLIIPNNPLNRLDISLCGQGMNGGLEERCVEQWS
jgi:hypothetical protein